MQATQAERQTRLVRHHFCHSPGHCVHHRDDLAVHGEVKGDRHDAELAAAYTALLRMRLAVDASIVPAERGPLAPLAGMETRQKPVRPIDKRFV